MDLIENTQTAGADAASPGRIVLDAAHSERLLTPDEVADHYRVTKGSILRWVAVGMPCQRIGPAGLLRFRLSETDEWHANVPNSYGDRMRRFADERAATTTNTATPTSAPNPAEAGR